MGTIKRIGVLTSGGDAPGMNAAVRAVVRTAISRGMECIGIRRGWQGLITSDFVRLSSESVGHTLSRGGTILFTARSEDFLTERMGNIYTYDEIPLKNGFCCFSRIRHS